MERRFDMSDFEQSLKDHADQFKMMPSKRVWNGIYNNLHPGSKWPSITVAIVFIITLVTIGTLNNSSKLLNHSTATNIQSSGNISKTGIEKRSGEAFADKNNSRINSSNIDLKNKSNHMPMDMGSNSKNITVKRSSAALSIQPNVSSQKIISRVNTQNLLSSNIESVKKEEDKQIAVNTSAPRARILLDGAGSINAVNEPINEISLFDKPITDESGLHPQMEGQSQNFIKDLPIFETLFVPPYTSLAGQLRYVDFIEPASNIQSKISSGNTAINANKFRRKKNNKIEWTFYVNPTISTVSFNKKTIEPSTNTTSLVVLSTQQPSFKVIHNPRFGIETGAEMSLRIDKKFQFITGINFSYSGYNNVSNLVHPTFATLTLNDNNGSTYSKTYITHYGNGQSQGNINLVNYSIEASIPVGIQYNILGNKKIRLDISSLLEPSVVLRDDAYLMSSDGRYFVNDPLLVRRTNLEGHFGSYITFIGKKIKWHLGPDFRYQLFSTYKNIYPTKEHLMDYGIRIGISK